MRAPRFGRQHCLSIKNCLRMTTLGPVSVIRGVCRQAAQPNLRLAAVYPIQHRELEVLFRNSIYRLRLRPRSASPQVERYIGSDFTTEAAMGP
jgi:hypothetical protein